MFGNENLDPNYIEKLCILSAMCQPIHVNIVKWILK